MAKKVKENQQNENAVTETMPEINPASIVTIVAVPGTKHMKAGKEYQVSGSTAIFLIKNKQATLKQ